MDDTMDTGAVVADELTEAAEQASAGAKYRKLRELAGEQLKRAKALKNDAGISLWIIMSAVFAIYFAVAFRFLDKCRGPFEVLCYSKYATPRTLPDDYIGLLFLLFFFVSAAFHFWVWYGLNGILVRKHEVAVKRLAFIEDEAVAIGNTASKYGVMTLDLTSIRTYHEYMVDVEKYRNTSLLDAKASVRWFLSVIRFGLAMFFVVAFYNINKLCLKLL